MFSTHRLGEPFTEKEPASSAKYHQIYVYSLMFKMYVLLLLDVNGLSG